MNGVPLFPLQTVLFPGGRLPLRIFEQRYLAMAKACLKDGTPFGVCLIREGAEVGAPAIPAQVGTLARIGAWDMPQLGVLQVVALGAERFRIRAHRAAPSGLVVGDIELLPPEADAAVPRSCSACARLLEHLVREQPALFEPPHRPESAAWVGARLAEVLPLPLGTKQQLLELSDALARLERINAMLAGARAAT